MYCTIKGWNFPHRLVIYFISHNGFLVWSPVVYMLLFNEAFMIQTIGLCVFRKQLNNIEIIFISMCAYICASVCLYVCTLCLCVCVFACACMKDIQLLHVHMCTKYHCNDICLERRTGLSCSNSILNGELTISRNPSIH